MGFQLRRMYDGERGEILLKPIGELDIYSTTEFKKLAEREYEKNKGNIRIDGSQMEYMDSTGLGAFMYLLNMVREDGGSITITGLKPNIRKLFTITKMDDFFTIAGDENE